MERTYVARYDYAGELFCRPHRVSYFVNTLGRLTL